MSAAGALRLFEGADEVVVTVMVNPNKQGMFTVAERMELLRAVTADLPGVDPGSVDVSVDNGTLTLTAHRSARSEDSVQWLASERFFGTYRRQLALGEGIDSTKISATYENGVLTVTIPLAERAKPRRVEVTHGGAAKSIQPTTVEAE